VRGVEDAARRLGRFVGLPARVERHGPVAQASVRGRSPFTPFG
jgi:hypothetical protein